MDFFTEASIVLTSALRIAVPLIFAALAGLYAEKAGIWDIGLEGKLLSSALAAASVAYATQSPWIGVAAGLCASVVISLLHGFATITNRGNQIISGVALNFMASGLTAILAISWFSMGGRTPQLSPGQRIPQIHLPFADEIGRVPLVGPIYEHILSGHSLLLYVALLAVPFTWWVFHETRFGLHVRAVGENPGAVDTAGISVTWLRYRALIVGGILCGFGGAYMSIGQSAGFIKDMSAGKGYMALAALIFAKWRPWPILFACLLFGFLDALAIRLQSVDFGVGNISAQIAQSLPYILTVFLLAGFMGKAHPPKAGGIPYVKES